ncbi:response regulator [Haloferula sp. BvORR071]|uniref:response regulator n=1 Tax=Haloferula sp. BvORR071 TaxID=1396141 RepID=UPI0005548F26|nr:response regulator [Haloferula sp. BvORR071]
MEVGPHIAVVDDHQEIRQLLVKYLGQHGFTVSAAASAAEFRAQLERSETPDLVVLDIMMPGEDGLSLCRHLRATTGLPVIFLTAMAEDTERIIGLEIGADDYLVKPFNPRELLARIRAVLRRSGTHATNEEPPLTKSSRLRFADKLFDLSRHEVTGSDGVAVPLSTAEYRLLCVFLEHPGKVLSRDALLDLTSGREAEVWDRSIDNQVSRLRRKIEEDPKNPMLIKTYWGDGYCFTGTVTPA